MKLLYPVCKSHMAFLFNVEEMFENWPTSIYMWTFTFEKFQPDWIAMRRWEEFKRKLCGNPSKPGGEYPLLVGLRVVEVHPGRNFHGLSHGLHFHCLFNMRVNIHRVKRLLRRYDFGRVTAKKVTKQQAQYVGKYLTKGQPELGKGTRRWGTINWPSATKVRTIKVESQFHTNMRKVQNAIKTEQLSPDVVHSIYVNTRLHGEYEEWPIDRYYYSNRSSEVLGPEDQCTRVQSFADPTLKSVLLRSNKRARIYPRTNKQTREQSMLRQAAIWKEKARRRSIGHEACVMEDYQKEKQARLESETKGSEKFFGPPRVFPGGKPGAKPGNGGTYYIYEYDKAGMITAGRVAT